MIHQFFDQSSVQRMNALTGPAPVSLHLPRRPGRYGAGDTLPCGTFHVEECVHPQHGRQFTIVRTIGCA